MVKHGPPHPPPISATPTGKALGRRFPQRIWAVEACNGIGVCVQRHPVTDLEPARLDAAGQATGSPLVAMPKRIRFEPGAPVISGVWVPRLPP
jgi:hypothetical protein